MVEDAKKRIRSQSERYEKAQHKVRNEIQRVAKREQDDVDASFRAVQEAERKFQETLAKLDKKLDDAYKNDKAFRKANDKLEAEQRARCELIDQLTSTYRGAQTQIVSSSTKTDEEKTRELTQMSKAMHECMSCDKEYKDMMAVLTQTLQTHASSQLRLL